MVVFTVHDAFEALDGVFERDEHAGRTREDFGNVERLRQETLDFTRAGNGEFVFFRQLVHTQNGDDVLQRLVALQRFLNGRGDLIVLFADDAGVENTRRGVERVNRGEDGHFGNLARQNGTGIQVRKRRCGGRVGQVVRRNVNGLNGGNRALGGGGNALLHRAHFGCERRLVTNRGGDTAKKRRHLCACLREAEDVINEEQNVLTFLVAEVFCLRQAGQRHARTRARRFVHLAVNEGHFGAFAIQLDNAGVNHLVIEVVAFARTLAHACEYRNTTVFHGDVVDELHNRNRLAHARTAEEADFTALRIRRQQVNDFNAGNEDLGFRRLLGEFRRAAVNGVVFFGVDGAALVNRLAHDVQDAAKRCGANGNRNRLARIGNSRAAHETFGRVHGDGAHGVFTKVLRNLQNQRLAVVVNGQRVQNGGQLAFELHVNNGTRNLYDFAGSACILCGQFYHGVCLLLFLNLCILLQLAQVIRLRHPK